MAAFLAAHGESDRPALPSHVLFNGGVFKAGILQQRMMNVLGNWSGQDAAPKLLAGEHDLDYAVARGAAYYGWTKGLSHYIAAASSKPWTTYTEEDGLPSNAVTLVAVAQDGAPWVGTEAGTVSRLDGRIWTTWTVQEVGAR